MLATKPSDKRYLRNRRATIIQYINNKERTLEEIQQHLLEKGYNESITTIRDDIKNFEQIGLQVLNKDYKYRIMEEIIGLDIPTNVEEDRFGKSAISKLKDNIREKLVAIPHKYLVLIDLSYDGKSNRDFEIQTIDLLTNELDFEGIRLGESRKPDGIIYRKNNGVIIDNKAYSKGYSLPMKQADEMIRYLEENKKRDKELNPNEWWKHFGEEVKKFNYLFVSSKFVSGFKDRLDYIANRTGINGAAIDAANLLLLAEELKTGSLSYEEGLKLLDRNEEITFMSKENADDI